MSKISQEKIDFVDDLIRKAGNKVGEKVRVDIVPLMEKFDMTWAASREVLQYASRQLGHRMAGPRSTIVVIGDAVEKPEPLTKGQIALNAAIELCARLAD